MLTQHKSAFFFITKQLFMHTYVLVIFNFLQTLYQRSLIRSKGAGGNFFTEILKRRPITKNKILLTLQKTASFNYDFTTFYAYICACDIQFFATSIKGLSFVLSRYYTKNKISSHCNFFFTSLQTSVVVSNMLLVLVSEDNLLSFYYINCGNTITDYKLFLHTSDVDQQQILLYCTCLQNNVCHIILVLIFFLKLVIKEFFWFTEFKKFLHFFLFPDFFNKMQNISKRLLF